MAAARPLSLQNGKKHRSQDHQDCDYGDKLRYGESLRQFGFAEVLASVHAFFSAAQRRIRRVALANTKSKVTFVSMRR
jgi:hypothetical protein